MKKTLVWSLAAAIALTPVIPTAVMASSQEVVVNKQTIAQIAAEKAALLVEYGTTSLQYAIIDNGKITVSGQAGMNDRAGKLPLTKDTVYGIGSTSKVFTAAAVMKLVDQGKIDLDTPVVHYIPEFKMADERYKQITPRMLLNHSSGIQGSNLANAFLFNDPDTQVHDKLLDKLSKEKLKADPGAFSVYCNDGFTLSEILVERVSKTTFTAFIQDNFAKPLGMNHTMTPQNMVEASKFAALYSPAYEGQLPVETTNAIGTGGIISTAEDLVRFSQIFTGQKTDVLSAKSAKAMEQEEYKRGLWPEDGDNSFDYGLGWDSVRLFPFNNYGIKALTKGGDTTLYHSSLVVLPEHNLAAAVVSSGGSSALDQLMASELLLQVLKEKGTIKEIKKEKSFGTPVKHNMPKEVAAYEGNYVNLYEHLEVKIKDGELTVITNGATEEKLVYTNDETFVNQEGNWKVKFVTEKNGRTYMWSRDYTTIPGLGQLANSEYYAEKITSPKLDKETTKAWEQREGKLFFNLNEKYSSVVHMNPYIIPIISGNIEGYFQNMKITGPNTAITDFNIPTMQGRDTFEALFYMKNGTEYLEGRGGVYLSEDGVKPIYHGKSSKATIQADGYARWFSIPQTVAGKKMSVVMPEKAGFIVYDGAGALITNTVISGKNEVVLPENGYIVFRGDAGAAFNISMN